MKKIARIALLLLCGILTIGAFAQGPNPPPNGGKPPRPGGGPGGEPKYTLEQAISDRAQLNTIAFSGLAFLTGSFGCDTFLPPGKVCDYFGFQNMRDVQAKGMGHNTDFLTRIANNMIFILTDTQRAQLIALGKDQESQINALALKRFPLIKSFCRQADGDIPAGSAGLNQDAVKKYTAEIFALDGQLAYQRAVVCGNILTNLSAEQKAYLAKLKFDDYTTWPVMAEPLDKRSMTHGTNVLVMTYASEMFSWYAGSLEADTYFCPERHGTYFGGFFMKDAPAMHQANYSISTTLTGDSGEQFLATLNPTQRERITSIIELQRADLQEMVTVRRAISTELRKLLVVGGTADKELVLKLSRRYGELDGEMSYYYATRFAEVNKTLTTEQKAALVKLRNMTITPRGAFVYSEPIAIPEVIKTDFLFTAPATK